MSWIPGLKPEKSPRLRALFGAAFWTVLGLSFGSNLAISQTRFAQAPSDEELIQIEIDKLERAYNTPDRPVNRRKIREKLAEALRNSEKVENQARGLRIHLDLNPSDQEARRELGEAALGMQRYGVAIRLFREVLRDQPQNLQARLYLGYSYQGVEQYPEALAAFEEVVRYRPTDREALLGSASSAMSLDKPNLAMQRAQVLLSLEPGHQEAATILAEAKKEIEEGVTDGEDELGELTPVEVVALARRRLMKDPKNVDLRVLLGDALNDAAWAGEARGEFLALIKEGSLKPEVLAGLAKSHRLLGDGSGARIYAERALTVDPKHRIANLEMARIWDFLDRIPLARRQYKRCVQLFSGDSVVLQEYGSFELEQDQLKVAERYLRAAIRISPEDATAYAYLAEVYWKRKKFDEAKAFLAKARTLSPYDQRGWRVLATIQSEALQFQDAAQSWKEYLQLAPLDREAWLLLSKTLVEVGDLPGAAKAIDVAWALDEEDPAIMAGVEEVMARLPWTPAREETRLLAIEKRAVFEADEQNFDESIRLLEGLAEDRSRQIRRSQAELQDPAPEDPPGRRRAVLTRLLELTKAKIRIHESLSQHYLELGRQDDLERQYLELYKLDPGSADVVRRLAQFFYDKDDAQRTVTWYKRLPQDARLEPEELLQFAKKLDETGREQQAERIYREMARHEHPMDEVEEGLSEHTRTRGNFYGHYRHARRARNLFWGNTTALGTLRFFGKDTTPDIWSEFFRFEDSDGIQVSEFSVGYRYVLDHRTDLALTTSYFSSQDRFTPKQTGNGGSGVMVRHRFSERFGASSRVGLPRLNTNDDLTWDLRLDYNPNDWMYSWMRVYHDFMFETPLASNTGFQETGFEIEGHLYASHRARGRVYFQRSNITGGQRKLSWEMDFAWRPFGPHLPGWIHFQRSNLNYRNQVAPSLYYAPNDQDRFDLWFEHPFRLGDGAFASATAGYRRDFQFATSQRAGINLTMDGGRTGNIVLDFNHVRRSRSYHDFANAYQSNEFSLAYNATF